MKPPARLTAFQPHRVFLPEKVICDRDTAAGILGITRAELDAELGGVEFEQLPELDDKANAEGEFLRDLRLDEAYPLGAVPTCRDIRRGRTA